MWSATGVGVPGRVAAQVDGPLGDTREFQVPTIVDPAGSVHYSSGARSPRPMGSEMTEYEQDHIRLTGYG